VTFPDDISPRGARAMLQLQQTSKAAPGSKPLSPLDRQYTLLGGWSRHNAASRFFAPDSCLRQS